MSTPSTTSVPLLSEKLEENDEGEEDDPDNLSNEEEAE